MFAEPAGATAYAGLISARDTGLVNQSDSVVVIATGSGLKDVSGAMRGVAASGAAPITVAPSLEALTTTLKPPTKHERGNE